MKKFKVLWSDYKKEMEYLIGHLIFEEGVWVFKYNMNIINEAIEKGFRPFPEFLDIREIYINPKLFKTFKNRLDSSLDLDFLDNLKQTDAATATDNVLVKNIGGNQHE